MTPSDKLPDLHAEVRKRLIARVGAGGDELLAALARIVGLSSHALDAFMRGAHLTPWAAERLERALVPSEHDDGRGDK